MVVRVARGEVWWAELNEPVGSEPGYPRPVLILQADSFNRSSLNTVVAVAFTGSLHLAAAPGNVLVSKRQAGVSKDSVINVSQIMTVDKAALSEKLGRLPPDLMSRVEKGVRLALGL